MRCRLSLAVVFAALSMAATASDNLLGSFSRLAGLPSEPAIMQEGPIALRWLSHIPSPPFHSASGMRRYIEEAERRGLEPDFLQAYLAYYEQRAYPNDSVDWTAYTDAIATRDLVPPIPQSALGIPPNGAYFPLPNGSKWQNVGPFNLDVPYSQYYGVRSTSGRVTGLAYDPSDTSIIYLTSAGGGVWKYEAGKWSSLSNDKKWPVQQASCVAVDPGGQFIYVGTGDPRGIFRLYGAGLMKSADAGTTWTIVGADKFGGKTISKVLIDPSDAKKLIVLTGGDPTAISDSGEFVLMCFDRQDYMGYIWGTDDRGAAWATESPTKALWTDGAFTIDQGGGKYSLFVVGFDAARKSLVYRRDTTGAWTDITAKIKALDAGFAGGGEMGMSVCTSPAFSKRVYVMSNERKKIYRSDDNGDTWSEVTDAVGGIISWSQLDYNYYIVCSKRVIRGGVEDVLYAAAISLAGRVVGSPWQDIGKTSMSPAPTHNDQHCLAINPSDPSEMVIGNDGGVYTVSYLPDPDPTKDKWVITSISDTPLAITQFYGAAYHATKADVILGGTQDNATPRSAGFKGVDGKDPSLTRWNNCGGGDGGQTAIFSEDVQYTTSVIGNQGIYRTKDAWKNAIQTSPTFKTGDAFGTFIPLAIDSTDNLYAAGQRYLYRGTYNGTTNTEDWSQATATSQLRSTGYITCIAVAPSDKKYLYAGASDGDVYMTADAFAGTVAWKKINAGKVGKTLPNDRYTTCIAVDPTNPKRVLVARSGTNGKHVYRCDDTTKADADREWVNCTGSATTSVYKVPVNAVVFDFDRPATAAWVGTDLGVYYTDAIDRTNVDDMTQTWWSDANDSVGLPYVQVNHLAAVPGTGYLNAATFGRGIWRLWIAKNTIKSFTITPKAVVFGDDATATVTIDKPVPTGSVASIQITSGNYNVAIPYLTDRNQQISHVDIPAGQTQATFKIRTQKPAVLNEETVTFYLYYAGSSKTANITVVTKRTELNFVKPIP